MGIRIDLTNERFDRLLVIKEFGKNKHGSILWLCKCDCGNEVVVSSNNLRHDHTKSCGCLNKKSVSSTNTTHGMKGTRFYNIYRGILQRCTNQNAPNYKSYGGRGIKCLWSSFEEFKEDMYESYLEHIEKYGEKNTSIDRIDVNGNYEFNNCKWATREEQQNNRRISNYLDIDGEILTVAQAARKYSINYQTIMSRLRNGKDIFGNKVEG